MSRTSGLGLTELLKWEPRDIATYLELLQAEHDEAMEPIRDQKRRKLHGLA